MNNRAMCTTLFVERRVKVGMIVRLPEAPLISRGEARPVVLRLRHQDARTPVNWRRISDAGTARCWV